MKKKEDMSDLISISEAARLRGVTHGAIQDLIARGKLTATEVAGRRLLKRGDVVSFEPSTPGRPPKSKAQEKAEKSVAKKRIRKKDPTRNLKTLS